MNTKSLLQAAVAIGALVPIIAGVAGVLSAKGAFGSASTEPVFMDSHYRYLSGLLLGIGLCFWTMIPRIERKASQFQLLAAIVFIGGLSRLYGLIVMGGADKAVLFSLVMELAVTPALALWQRAVAHDYQSRLSL